MTEPASDPPPPPGQPPPNQPPTGQPAPIPAKTQLLEEMTSLARSQPNVFQTLIQHIWNESEGIPIEVPPEIITQAIQHDGERSKRDHGFRVLVVWALVLIALLALSFTTIIIWLMRDHVEFTTKVIEGIGLIVTHSVVGVGAGIGAYQVGKSAGRNSSET
jgi:hypothetical protein